MSLDENLDLALVGFKDLIDLGERKSVDQPSSLSRPELVKELRKMGAGVLPQPASPNGTLEQLSSLVSCVSTLSKEIVMSKEDRDSTMLALKLKIQELRREVVELCQQKSSIPDPLPHTVPPYTSQQNIRDLQLRSPTVIPYAPIMLQHHKVQVQVAPRPSLPNKAKGVLHAPVILVVVQSTQPTHNAVKQGSLAYVVQSQHRTRGKR